MPSVKFTKDSYVDGRYYKAGEILPNYNGPMGSGIVPATEAERVPPPTRLSTLDRVKRLENAVGLDVIQAAEDKRVAAETEAREKAAADQKVKDEEAAAAKAAEDAKADEPKPAETVA